MLADKGVAIASEWMFTPELAGGAVKRVLADWELHGIDLWAVFPNGRMVSAKARAVVAWVEEIFGPQIEAFPIDAPPSTNIV